jgi:hypothetical protein
MVDQHAKLKVANCRFSVTKNLFIDEIWSNRQKRIPKESPNGEIENVAGSV